MNSLTQPFRFPKKLWLALSFACFVYLFLAVAVNYKGDQPTAWRAFLDGDIGMGVAFGILWLTLALGVGALVATVFGILRQLLSKAKP